MVGNSNTSVAYQHCQTKVRKAYFSILVDHRSWKRSSQQILCKAYWTGLTKWGKPPCGTSAREYTQAREQNSVLQKAVAVHRATSHENRYMCMCEDQGRQTNLALQNLVTKHSFIHYSHWLLRTKRVTNSYRRYWYPWRTPHPAITSDTNIPLTFLGWATKLSPVSTKGSWNTWSWLGGPCMLLKLCDWL